MLRELYQQLRLYKNFFQPTMKLKSKTRVGGKIKRQYDRPRTPYQRLLESHQLSSKAEQQLRDQYESLNVAQLRRNFEQLRRRLFELVEAQQPAQPPRRQRMPPMAIGAAARTRQAWNRAAGQ